MSKEVKIIDTFIFYNELELLHYRLAILYELVDYFVIVESTHTFTGKQKSLIYNENKHLFSNYKEKIIHIIVDDMPFIYPNINYDNREQWKNEYHQRNAIQRGLQFIKINDQDVITLTDLDEIPNPDILLDVKNKKINIELSSLHQYCYTFNLDQYPDDWFYPKIFTYEKYKQLNLDMDSIRGQICPVIENAGWHLSYFGDARYIQNKIMDFSHQELNSDDVVNLDNIEHRLKTNKDIFNRHGGDFKRKCSVKDNIHLPLKYEIYLQNFFTPDNII